MSSRTATIATESVTTPVITCIGAPLDAVAAIARRRAGTLNSDLGTDVLVQRTLKRFDETFGTTSSPPRPGRLDQAGDAERSRMVPPVGHGPSNARPSPSAGFSRVSAPRCARRP